MHCPFCGHEETKVNDSRLAAEGAQIRRRRECLQCGERFTTFETAELVMPLVVKSDQRRVPFDENKLRGGLAKALEKRPVSRESIEEAVGHITRKLRSARRTRSDLAPDRRDRDGRAAPARRSRVRALRLGVPALPGRRGVSRRDRAHASPPRPHRERGSARADSGWSAAEEEGTQMKFSAFDEVAMRRALELAARGLYSTRAESARRRRAGARPGNRRRRLARAPRPAARRTERDSRRGRARARRHRLRHARTVQSFRPHAALRRCAARGRRAPRRVRGRRSESARERRGRGAPEKSRRASSNRACSSAKPRSSTRDS